MRGAGSALFQDTRQGCDADRLVGATGRPSESPEDPPARRRTGRCGLCGRARLPQRPTMMPAPALFAGAVSSGRADEGRPGSGTDPRGPEGPIHSAASGGEAQFSGAGRYHALICGRVGNVQTVPTSRADVEHASAPSLGLSAAPPPVAVGRDRPQACRPVRPARAPVHRGARPPVSRSGCMANCPAQTPDLSAAHTSGL